MISEITIRNLGVIEDAHFHLSEGLNALTGETGAGKTMALTALQLLMGAKADPGKVRNGAIQAEIEGIFTITENSPVARIVADAGGSLDFEDGVGDLVVVRIVPLSGRSRAIVGGRSVPIGVLRELAQFELTIHGQAEQMRLTSVAEQRSALDVFGGDDIKQCLAKYSEAWSYYHACLTELDEFETNSRTRGAEKLALEALVKRVSEVNPRVDEEDDLKQRAIRLENSESIRETLSSAVVLLDGSSGVEGAATLADSASTLLQKLNDPEFSVYEQQLRDISSVLSDISRELIAHVDNLDTDPEALDALYTRRAELKSLQMDLGMNISQILEEFEHAQQRLADMTDPEKRHRQLLDLTNEARKAVKCQAEKLTKLREEAARLLEIEVTQELSVLNMKGAEFKVLVATDENLASTGQDRIEFQLQTGETRAVAVHKAASGGEISRIMLALEVILAERGLNDDRTFVFDEVDAGIGGETALLVGERLHKMSLHNQVLVVTHLAQVAAHAETHIKVAKDLSAGIPVTSVTPVRGDERVEELARMLSGNDSQTARAHADELLSSISMAR